MSDLPLADVRILDLTRLLPGGFCSQLFADFGADVVKVEDTGMGDYVRWAPPFYGDEAQQGLGTRSALYLSLNRGKRSIRLDLKSDEGREAFLRLVESADVVLEGFRPGVMDRLGIGYEVLRERNKAVVLGSISGYGATGPNVARSGHDMNYLGLIGVLGMTGEPPVGDATPESTRPVQSAAQIADLGGGALMAAFGVMAALHEARRTGEGQFVDVSMADGALAWTAMSSAAYLCDGHIPKRGAEQLNGGFVCYLPYEAQDGWITCGALEPKFWAAFCNGVGRPELIERQFETPGGEAWEQVAEIFRERTRADWKAFADENDCCIEPVLDLGEALDSDLVRERDMVVEFEQPEIGPVRTLGVPVKMSRTPGRTDRPAPAFGEHTEEVLASAGYSDEEIAAMTESGVVAGPGATSGPSFLG